MKPCWAASLGNCSAKMSNEHLISASIFGRDAKIDVEGLSWCKGQTKSIGISSLTSKILCTNHNSLLSEIDREAGHFFALFNTIFGEIRLHKISRSNRLKTKHFTIFGPHIERWFLKTLLNLHASGTISENSQPGEVSNYCAQLAYGQTPFIGKSGLYIAAHVGWQLQSSPEVCVTPLIFDGVMMAGLFKFRGWLFVIWLYQNEMPRETLNKSTKRPRDPLI